MLLSAISLYEVIPTQPRSSTQAPLPAALRTNVLPLNETVTSPVRLVTYADTAEPLGEVLLSKTDAAMLRDFAKTPCDRHYGEISVKFRTQLMTYVAAPARTAEFVRKIPLEMLMVPMSCI